MYLSMVNARNVRRVHVANQLEDILKDIKFRSPLEIDFLQQ